MDKADDLSHSVGSEIEAVVERDSDRCLREGKCRQLKVQLTVKMQHSQGWRNAQSGLVARDVVATILRGNVDSNTPEKMQRQQRKEVEVVGDGEGQKCSLCYQSALAHAAVSSSHLLAAQGFQDDQAQRCPSPC